MNNKEKYVSIGQASKLLGVCVETIRRWIKEGKITALTLPTKHRRFSIEEVNKLLNK